MNTPGWSSSTSSSYQDVLHDMKDGFQDPAFPDFDALIDFDFELDLASIVVEEERQKQRQDSDYGTARYPDNNDNDIASDSPSSDQARSPQEEAAVRKPRLRRACDQCRAQKLKCLRGADSHACQRCQQGGISNCVYSPRSARRSVAHRRRRQDSLCSDLEPEEVILADLASADPLAFTSGQTWLEILSPPRSNSIQNAQNPPAGSQNVSDGKGSRVCEMQLSQCLSALSQKLERLLHVTTTDWPKRNIWQYPIGTFFNAAETLSTTWKAFACTSSQPNTGALADSVRIKNLLMAMHCYLLSVTISAALSVLLVTQLSRSSVDGDSSDGSASRAPSTPSLTSYDTPIFCPDLQAPGALSMPFFDAGRHVTCSDPSSFSDSYRNALSSACVTLSTSLRIVRDIELVLGVTYEQGVLGHILGSNQPVSSSRQSSFDKASVPIAASGILSSLTGGESAHLSSASVASECRKPFSQLKRSWLAMQSLVRQTGI